MVELYILISTVLRERGEEGFWLKREHHTIKIAYTSNQYNTDLQTPTTPASSLHKINNTTRCLLSSKNNSNTEANGAMLISTILRDLMKYILVKEGKEGPGLLIYISIFIFLW
jgi:hypothetical protein